jgi:hypothetical protein
MFIPYEEYIWGDKFKNYFTNINPNVSYSNNPDIEFVRKTLSRSAKLIITHNGDTPVWCDNVNEYPNCQYWFGQNIMCDDPRVIPLPIGLENDYINGQPQRKMILQEKSKSNITPTKLLYLNCSISTCRADRQPAYDYFSTKNWCTVKIPNHSNYYNFCDDVLDHQFMLSPRGNGLDCHRSWEILYLNRYPVMKKYYGLQKLFEDLPVIFVDNWTDVTPEFLSNQLETIKNSTYNMDKLKFSYWKSLIENHIGKLK